MSETKQQLRVVYDGGQIDTELDDALEGALASLGFARWASGFDLVDNERDLAFQREVHHPVQAESQESATGAGEARLRLGVEEDASHGG